MDLSFSELTHLLIEFVDKNFVCLMSPLSSIHKQAVANWEHFKTQIQVQNIQRWKLQDFVRNTNVETSKPVSTLPHFQLHHSYPAKNVGSTIDSGSFSNFYLNEKWDKSRKENSKVQSLGSVTGLSFLSSPEAKRETNGSFKNEEKQLNRQDQQSQSIEGLLFAFRKLCTNFQNNHRKLMRDQHFEKES